MDKGEALKIAEEYIRLVESKYALQKALVFGSCVKGSPRPDSDIDIAIVFTRKEDILKAQLDLMKLRRPVDLRIEPHPFSSSDFNNTDPLVNEIMKYGIEVNRISMAAEPKAPYEKRK